MNVSDIILHWVDQISRVHPDQFTPVTDFFAFPSRARTESLHWCKMLFSEESNPHAVTNQAIHSYYPAGKVNLDLLKHQYVAAGRSLTVFEGVNFVILQASSPEAKHWTQKSVAEFLNWALNRSGGSPALSFDYPDAIGELTFISSAPEVDPAMMASWKSRVDLLIEKQYLYIVVYKRYSGMLGFLNDAQWLENDLRHTSP